MKFQVKHSPQNITKAFQNTCSTIESLSFHDFMDSIEIRQFSMEDISKINEKKITISCRDKKRDSIRSIETNVTDQGQTSDFDLEPLDLSNKNSLYDFIQLCSNFHQNGCCLNGFQCTKIHGSSELSAQDTAKNSKLTKLQNFPQIFTLKDKRTRSFLLF